MAKAVAIVGAGVSGLTCGILCVEHGFHAKIFAEQIGQSTTSGAAAAIWFPYDCEPREKVIAWALDTYKTLAELARDLRTGVSMIGLCQFSRTGDIEIPDWARSLGAHSVNPSEVEESGEFRSGYAIQVPLMDTTIYLDYLASRFRAAGGEICGGVRFTELEDVDPELDLVINCTGIGARALVNDVDLEPHRGQVAIVAKIDNLSRAIVCDDAPLMYAIPRRNDCVLGGTNEVSDSLEPDPASTPRVVAECSRVLNIGIPRVLAERVGLRPFRSSGVRLERGRLRDGRTVIHNYGHGGAGFTLSWGCAQNAFALADCSG